MATFHNGEIILTDEDKKIFKECLSSLSNPKITPIPKLKEAFENNFIGYEIKERETGKITEAKEFDKQEQLDRIEKKLDEVLEGLDFLSKNLM